MEKACTESSHPETIRNMKNMYSWVMKNIHRNLSNPLTVKEMKICTESSNHKSVEYITVKYVKIALILKKKVR